MSQTTWRELHYKEIDSTNLQAKRLAREWKAQAETSFRTGDRIEKTVITADSQTAGRGRLGRSWDSPAGSGLWMSLLFCPDLLPASASMLTLVAALAAAKGIEQTVSLKPQIKWPNDLVSDGKKICGILTEMHADLHQIEYVVVGIGINVTMTDFPPEIGQKATSLYLCSGQKADLDRLKKEILKAFDDFYEVFRQKGDLSLLKEAYEERLVSKGKQVRILSAASQTTGSGESGGGESAGGDGAAPGEWTGICLGISENGGLLIRKVDGETEEIVSGEVSVRGIYGYV